VIQAQASFWQLTLFCIACIAGKSVSYGTGRFHMHTRPVSFPNWKEVLAHAALCPLRQAAYTREILTFLRHCKANRTAATVEWAKQYLVWREKQSTGPAREALRWFYREGSRQPATPDAAGAGEWNAGPTRDAIKPAAGPADPPRECGESASGGHAPPLAPERESGLRAACSTSQPGPHGETGPPRRSMEPPPAASDLGTEPWERDLIKAIRVRGLLWRTEQTYREWAVRFARFIAPRSPYAASGDECA